jgi:uncharacterized protein (TIGR03118 family)
MARQLSRTWLAATAVGLTFACAATAQAATRFKVTNLVSDGSVPAVTTDPDLINPWGVAYSPMGPFWVSDNGMGLATVYTGAGAKVPLTVTIAPPGGSRATAAPTGQVFNSDSSEFKLTANPNSAAAFIFDTEDGTISGWSSKVSLTSSILEVDNSAGGTGAVYKGLAIAGPAGSQTLYATNFRSGNVEMYNDTWAPTGTFTDATVMPGYAPFNIQQLNGHLFVTFALQDGAKHDDVGGPGNGYVDEFNLNGTFDQRIVSAGGPVNSPWGLAIAPSSFGTYAGDLLVGNFGDGTISAFDLTTDAYEGQLLDAKGNPIVLGDLWALMPGNGNPAANPGDIYFTAGVLKESEGLFGSISAIPEPATWLSMILGMGLVGAGLRARTWKARTPPQIFSSL